MYLHIFRKLFYNFGMTIVLIQFSQVSRESLKIVYTEEKSNLSLF